MTQLDTPQLIYNSFHHLRFFTDPLFILFTTSQSNHPKMSAEGEHNDNRILGGYKA